LVYVSCNPHTLMRDLQLLQIEKQHVKKIIPLDQFPLTSHYEVIVHLDFFNTKKSSLFV
jgi:23S rRNA (uracil1939-C5)-methyltransferase